MALASLPERWDSLCPHGDATDPPWRRIHRGLSIRGRTGPLPIHAGVTLRGEVHVCCERPLEGVLIALLDAGVTSLHMDVADVVFLDGAGARTLASTAQRLEARGGHLRVQQPGASATQLLERTGLGRLLVPATRRLHDFGPR